AITAGQRPESYARKTAADGKHSFIVAAAGEEFSADPIEHLDTSNVMEAAIDDLMTHLRGYYSGEGMYVIENILLRPQEADDSFLPICVDPACTGCYDDDPYSYRIHIVPPAYAGRFHNLDFRRFVDETSRPDT